MSADQIQRRVAELGAAISVDYAGLDPLLVGALRGVTLFMADLMRVGHDPAPDRLPGDHQLRRAAEAGVQRPVRITKDLEIDVAGRHVLFVEDMVDTGLSLNYMLRLLRDRQPASLHVCTMFNKQRLRLFNLPLRYVGFELPDRYVVGYGLDYRQLYRNLPYVGVLSAGVLLSGD